MTLQGLTVAVAPSGVQYFAQMLLAPAVTHALGSLTAPSKTIPVANIVLYSSKYSSESAENISITLSSGQLNGFVPVFSSIVQNQNGQFTMVMNAPAFSCSFNWNEQYNDVTYSFSTHTKPVNTNYPYTVGFAGMTVTIVFRFEYVGNSWKFTFVSASPAPGTVTPNIPGGSVVNREDQGCFTSNVSDATKAAVDTIDFAGAVNTAISPMFSAIPATGQITADIAFQFQEGPAGLTFPGDSGVAAGVSGVAIYDGTVYTGAQPPTLPVPAIPTTRHLAYDVSDYTLNSLMWAFFSEGELRQNVSPGDIPDSAVLNTGNYNNTPLQSLYTTYPNLPMTAGITATAAPTVTLEQIYVLTDAAYATLKPQLPQDVYTKLNGIVHQAFLAEADFYAMLSNMLGQASAGQYKTIIEAAASSIAAVVTHADRVVLNVVQDGTPIPVITFDVAQTDVLQNFGLGISGAAQSLQFDFQIIPSLTKTTFVSSTLAGIDGSDFTFIWNMALQPAYANTVAKIGRAGVALPRIPGFNFLFSQAVVTLQNGYVSVITDVQHTNDAAMTFYLASKLVGSGSS